MSCTKHYNSTLHYDALQKEKPTITQWPKSLNSQKTIFLTLYMCTWIYICISIRFRWNGRELESLFLSKVNLARAESNCPSREYSILGNDSSIPLYIQAHESSELSFPGQKIGDISLVYMCPPQRLSWHWPLRCALHTLTRYLQYNFVHPTLQVNYFFFAMHTLVVGKPHIEVKNTTQKIIIYFQVLYK